MNYGFVVTRQGLDLITKLLIPEDLVLTRVMVGNGRLDESSDPISFTDLVSPIAPATSTTPIVNNHQLEFTVEFRNDLNGGLQTGFWLNEFGVFAQDPDVGEILLYYATLGDYPIWVQPISTGAIDVRRFPVSLGLSNDVTVVLQYPAVAFLTAEDLAAHNQDPNAHHDLFAAMQAQIDALMAMLSPSRNGVIMQDGGTQNSAVIQRQDNGEILPLVLNVPRNL